MNTSIDYSADGAVDEIIELLQRGESVDVIVKNKNTINWLLWYLPYVFNVNAKKSPLWKTLYSFIVLRNFHAIYGTSLSIEQCSMTYRMDNDFLHLIFTNANSSGSSRAN
ncbi:MAG: hypothetical protein V4660_17630 [Pseudomonadota bacterium]